MIKRPLCMTVVILISLQYFFLLWSGERILFRPALFEKKIRNGTEIHFVGRIDFREQDDQKMIYSLDQCVVTDSNDHAYPQSKILVYVKENNLYMTDSIQIGDVVEGKGKLYSFEHVTNPGQFDQYFYYQKNQISASVIADSMLLKMSEPNLLKEKTAEFRQWWKQVLLDELGDHYGNIMSAIFLGDKHGLNPEVRELYQKSGIGHILAISGLHMSFLGIGVYQLLRRSGVGFLGAGLIGILFLTIYYLMIGESVSAVRALIMFMIKMGAEITGRTYDMLTSTAIAAVIILLWRPLYLFDSGFLLSFSAILGVALLNERLKQSRIPNVFSAGLAIQIMTLPWMLYFYYEIPIFSIVINLVVIPLMSLVFACGMAAPVIGIFWLTGRSLLLKVCAWILLGYEKICESMMRIPVHRIVSGQPAKWMIAGYYLMLLMILIIPKWSWLCKRSGDRKIHQLMFIVRIGYLAFSVLMLFGTKIISNPRLSIVMLDVGQGEAIYIHTPSGKNILVDSGSSSVSDIGRYRVEPFLKSQGISRLDYIFVSHGDGDHISGILEMLENQNYGVRIKNIVLPPENVINDVLWEMAETASRNGTQVVTIQESESISDQQMKITCLAPEKEKMDLSGNAASMVLCVQYKQFKMLFTGDFEGDEGDLAKRAGRCNVLKVAHHGSKNSTNEAFLKQIRPDVALISSGKNNRYGHPHEETLKRLEEYTKRIYNTQTSGAIEISTDGKHIEIEEYLK